MTSAGPTARAAASERRIPRGARSPGGRRGPGRLRALGFALALAALAAAAFRPLLEADLRAPDLRLLARAAAGPDAEPPAGGTEGVLPVAALSLRDVYAIDPGGSLLGNAELALHARVTDWRSPGATALPLRLSALALHLVAAVALALFLRRLLLPWTGSEHAGAAALAAMLLYALHPFAVGTVANAGARPELWSLALSAVAAVLFLRGRQDRRNGYTAAAAIVAVLAGLGGGAALYLPFALATAEFFSAHRYRPRRDRVRTAANTLLVFGLAVSVDVALRAGPGDAALVPAFAAPMAPLEAARHAIERVGLLVLPVNVNVAGAVGLVAALAVFLVALQPALVAARSAPRLWGWLLVLWFAGLAAAAAHRLSLPLSLGAQTNAHALGIGAAVMAAGLGLGATALRGPRRAWTPWVAALAYAAVLHAASHAWAGAGAEATELRRDLSAARELWGTDARVLVLDAPHVVLGVEPFGDDLAWLAHPLLDGGAGGARGEVRGLSTRAFLALAREPELERARRSPHVVLAPAEELGGAPDPLRPQGGRIGVLLPPPQESGVKRSWRQDVRSPDLELAPLQASWVRASAPPEAVPAGLQRLRWRATEPAASDGTLPLVRAGGGALAHLVGDVGSSLEWRLGGRVRRIWIEGGLAFLSEAEVLDRPPALAERLAPEPDGVDWLFTRPRAAEVEGERGAYALELLSLESYEWVELPVEPLGDGLLRVSGAASAVRSMAIPVAWALDWRVDGATISRASGRRIGRGGTVEEVSRR